MSDDLEATLLLQLRLRAFAPTEDLVPSAGGREQPLLEALDSYRDRGWVQFRDGRIQGWSLTASGRRRGQDLLIAEMDAAGARGAVADAYDAFLPLNAELLSICTDWQVVEVDGTHVPNDHSDPGRDAAVLRRLDSLQPAAERLTSVLGDALARFAGYGPRLREAHGHVVAGRTEWLARATGPSYHGVWFELHEHLLAVLDRDRVHEPVPEHIPTTTGPVSGSATNGDER